MLQPRMTAAPGLRAPRAVRPSRSRSTDLPAAARGEPRARHRPRHAPDRARGRGRGHRHRAAARHREPRRDPRGGRRGDRPGVPRAGRVGAGRRPARGGAAAPRARWRRRPATGPRRSATRLGLPVTMRDERLSSFEAERRLGRMPRGRSGGPPSRTQRNAFRARIDREAASVILQDELDARRAGDRAGAAAPVVRAPGSRTATRRSSDEHQGRARSARGHGRAGRTGAASGPTATSAPGATAAGPATSAATTATATAAAACAASSGFVVFLAVLAAVVMLAHAHGRPAHRPAGHRAPGEDNPRALRIGFVADLVREDLGDVADGARRRRRRRGRVHRRGRRHARHARAPPRRGRDHRRASGRSCSRRAWTSSRQAHGRQVRAGRQPHAGSRS